MDAAVAEAQGRVAGLSASDYLQQSAARGLESNLRTLQQSVVAARKEAIAFYPDIEAGRAALALHWQKRAKGAIRS